MRTDQHSTAYLYLARFLLGAPVPVSQGFVQHVIRRYPLRCASRRGYVIVIADWLVRLSEDPNGWTAQKLSMSPDAARAIGHEHRIVPVQVDGDDHVITCPNCGMEW